MIIRNHNVTIMIRNKSALLLIKTEILENICFSVRFLQIELTHIGKGFGLLKNKL